MPDSWLEWSTLRYGDSAALDLSCKGPSLGQEERSSSPYIEYISMVVSEESFGVSSEDWVRPGVDGAVEMEGDGEGASFASRGVGGTTMRFGVSIREGEVTPLK